MLAFIEILITITLQVQKRVELKSRITRVPYFFMRCKRTYVLNNMY